MGGTSDLSKLSQENKNKLMSLVNESGSTLGLTVKFGKNSQGKTTVVAADSNGGTILKMSTADAIGNVTNFDTGSLINAIESMVEFSNNPDKGEFTPVGGDMIQTATGYRNVMLVGVVLVVAAGGIFVVSKRQFA